MKKSAGILPYRRVGGQLQVMLVHPGGPFYKNKDEGVWSVTKGEYLEGENPLDAAKREFEEETGQQINGAFIPLTPIKQKSGKQVLAWAVETDLDTANIRSNTFPMEWPPKSEKIIQVPEIDKAEWFDINDAKRKILPAQVPLLEDLDSHIKE